MKLPDCDLIPKLLEQPGRCVLPTCGKVLPFRRSRWCSDKCYNAYYSAVYANHDWSRARKAALRRDKYRCVKCGSDGRDNIPKGRKHGLEVNHIEPRRGAEYGFGCWHHQDNLESLCRSCHILETIRQRGPAKIEPEAKPRRKRAVKLAPNLVFPQRIPFLDGSRRGETINSSFLTAAGCRPGGMWPERIIGFGLDAYRWEKNGLRFVRALRTAEEIDAVFPSQLAGAR